MQFLNTESVIAKRASLLGAQIVERSICLSLTRSLHASLLKCDLRQVSVGIAINAGVLAVKKPLSGAAIRFHIVERDLFKQIGNQLVVRRPRFCTQQSNEIR
jgi:hypothetical protein